jgi:hypothetical protein
MVAIPKLNPIFSPGRPGSHPGLLLFSTPFLPLKNPPPAPPPPTYIAADRTCSYFIHPPDFGFTSRESPTPLRFASISITVLLILMANETCMGQALFAPYYARFLLRTDDIRQVKQDKIALLLNIVNPDNLQPILREFIVRISCLRYFDIGTHGK